MTTRTGGHLPIPLSSFVGRAGQTREVVGLLATSRLVTLVGPGGTGKTRLALEAVRHHLDAASTASCWVDLGPLSDPDLLAPRTAQALGVHPVPGEPIADTIGRVLREATMLLVLDTCEHLGDAVSRLVAGLLGTCPGSAVLATSREPIGVTGEVTWPVPPLSVPQEASYDAVAASEAGALFVERAQRVAPGFRLTSDNAPAVAEICRRLDGLPLAVELAAARVRALSPQRIARGIDDRFRLLAGGSPASEPRHRSVLASIEWSHALLTAPERVVLHAVGAFAGSFTLEGAAAVAAGGEVAPEDVLGLLTTLVDRSLVVADTSRAEPRFQLLDSVRVFARDRLAEAGEAEQVSRRHLDHLAGLVSEIAPRLLGPSADQALRALDEEIDDLRQALDWTVRTGDAERSLALVEELHWYWRIRGPFEGRARWRAALELGGSERRRCAALVGLASLEMVLGNIDEATRHATAARDLATAIDDLVSRGRALVYLGWLTIMQERDLLVATAILEEAVETCAEVGDTPYEALAHNALGFSVIGLPPGRERARVHIERGAALGRSIGFERPIVEGELWLAYLETIEGEFASAADRLGRLLEPDIWRWEPLLRAVGAATFVEILTATGRHRHARTVLDTALAAADEAREVVGAAHLRLAAGYLLHATGDLDAAAADLERAHAVLVASFVREAARCEELLALIALRQGDRSTALSLAERCPVQARTFPYIRATAPGLQALAMSHQQDDPATAADVWHELLAACVEVGHRPGVCDALEGLATSYAALGRYDDAARGIGAAEALRRELGYERLPVQQPDHGQTVGAVRGAIGDMTFEQTATTTASLPWTDAIALVQRGRGPRGRPSHGWHSLTPTEHQVVALVAEGLTNPQIGERMFVSARTVQSHLRHVFAKLDLATRSELAALAVARHVGSTRQ